MSVSRNRVTFSFMKSFCGFTSTKRSVEILISNVNMYMQEISTVLILSFHSILTLFMHFSPLSFIFTLINLSFYSYIYLTDFHFLLKKLTKFSRKGKKAFGTVLIVKQKNVDTKPFIQVYLQKIPIRLALTVKLQLPCPGSVLLASPRYDERWNVFFKRMCVIWKVTPYSQRKISKSSAVFWSKISLIWKDCHKVSVSFQLRKNYDR